MEIPEWEKELRLKLKKDLIPLLEKRDGPAILAQKLPEFYSPIEISEPNEHQRAWELVGLYFLNQKRFYESLPIFFALYHHMLLSQNIIGNRIHKGMPLCWISDCFAYLGYRSLSKKYIMLTLCEDAIYYEKGEINREKTGVYPRLVITKGLPEFEFDRYAKEINRLEKDNKNFSNFPEFFLQEIDNLWSTEIVSENEISTYYMNSYYFDYLFSLLGDSQGKTLERLAAYVLSCMPGCRISMRKKSKTTEYDVIGNLEGNFVDFRSELGRYFLCECKDWNKVVGSQVLRSFASVLDNSKLRFGIIFSNFGISGEENDLNANKVIENKFQRDGVTILSLDNNDFDFLRNGGNLIALLKRKYEILKFDLFKPLE